MRVIRILMVSVTLSACVSQPPEVADLEYRSIPDALLAACTLPQIPESTAQLSDAFVSAYKCAELGNSDKAAIAELIK